MGIRCGQKPLEQSLTRVQTAGSEHQTGKLDGDCLEASELQGSRIGCFGGTTFSRNCRRKAWSLPATIFRMIKIEMELDRPQQH